MWVGRVYLGKADFIWIYHVISGLCSGLSFEGSGYRFKYRGKNAMPFTSLKWITVSVLKLVRYNLIGAQYHNE